MDKEVRGQQTTPRRNEYPRRNNYQGTPHNNHGPAQVQGGRNQQEHGQHRENVQPRNMYREAPVRENAQKEFVQRDNNREYQQRDNHPRYNHSSASGSQGYAPRHSNRVRAIETIDDIKADIIRIEKEIELEIREIRSLKLGL